MTIRRSSSPSFRAKHCLDASFRIQNTPPLSFQQYARSLLPLPGAAPWVYAYRRKHSTPSYSLKQYNEPKPKAAEPIWHPVSPYRDKPPASLSPQKRSQKLIHEPIWQPTGYNMRYKPVPHFDPPSLRWSLQQLRKSTPSLTTPKTHKQLAARAVQRSRVPAQSPAFVLQSCE